MLHEAQYPGHYCCHLYDKDKINGDIYSACISEKTNSYQRLDMGTLDWNEKLHYYTCGTKVSHKVCRITRSEDSLIDDDIWECFESNSARADFLSGLMDLYMFPVEEVSGSEYSYSLKEFKFMD